jgi:outer membrane cobalamin receptor
VIAPLLALQLAVAVGSAPAAVPAAADSAAVANAAADSVRAASQADSIVLTLPELRIERERALGEARRRLPTAFVSEIATRRSSRALETLSEVLGEAAGVHVDEYGGLGAFSTVSLRGAPPGQVS